MPTFAAQSLLRTGTRKHRRCGLQRGWGWVVAIGSRCWNHRCIISDLSQAQPSSSGCKYSWKYCLIRFFLAPSRLRVCHNTHSPCALRIPLALYTAPLRVPQHHPPFAAFQPPSAASARAGGALPSRQPGCSELRGHGNARLRGGCSLSQPVSWPLAPLLPPGDPCLLAK